jgi:hypothetical protein
MDIEKDKTIAILEALVEHGNPYIPITLLAIKTGDARADDSD